jgi:hypothetical protein
MFGVAGSDEQRCKLIPVPNHLHVFNCDPDENNF